MKYIIIFNYSIMPTNTKYNLCNVIDTYKMRDYSSLKDI